MLTATEIVVFEFRCPKCFFALTAKTDQVGTPYVCPKCGSQHELVPEATESRIAAGQTSQGPAVGQENASRKNVANNEYEFTFDDTYEREYKRFKSEYGLTVSPLVRFCAKFIDSLCMTVTMILGFFLAGSFVAALNDGAGGEPSESASVVFFAVAGILPLTLGICQWVWTANKGKTIGKKLLGIRVARTEDDLPPGFISGVFMRSWVNYLLRIIPFYALIDALYVFSEEGRCIHDRLAGTIVLQGNVPRASNPGIETGQAQ